MLLPVPCSVIALAIGSFACSQVMFVDRSSTSGDHDQTLDTNYQQKDKIACKVYSAPIMIDIACKKLLHWTTKYLITAQMMLRDYPFDKLDIVVLPKCFGCLGLARYV